MTLACLRLCAALGAALGLPPNGAAAQLSAPATAPQALAPATLDAVMQQAYLKASNTGAGDSFGLAVAISGDTLVVGARGEDSGATGVNGNQGSNGAPGSGAAYVLVRSGGSWTQQAYLKASNTGAGDGFGIAVAIDGDTLVVGASGEASAATGVNGDQDSNASPGSGAAYVFVRSGGSWSQQAYLKASNTDPDDQFGGVVAVRGDLLVVGAIYEDSAATGVNGDGSDNSAPLAGAAYVFARSGSTWSQQAYLKASNTGTGEAVNDNYCSSASIFGETIVIGADAEDSAATGVNGDEGDDSAPSAGAVYVYERSGSDWSQQAYLKASNTGAGDQFGEWVSLWEDTLLVGAGTEDSSATGVDGAQGSNDAPNAGAAYVFVRSGGAWTQQAYLKASNTGANDRFGRSVSLWGDTAVIGAIFEDSSATGVDGAQADNAAANSGAAYLFVRRGSEWSQQAYLKAGNTGAGDNFALPVSLSGDTVVLGAAQEDGSATGVNGDGTSNGLDGSGAAYVLDLGLLPEAWTDLGFGLAGISGVPVLLGAGPLVEWTAGTLQLTAAKPSSPAVLFLSLASVPVPFKGGQLAAFPFVLALGSGTGPAGALSLPFLWPAGIPSAIALHFQFAIQDGAALQGVALSNALQAVTP